MNVEIFTAMSNIRDFLRANRYELTGTSHIKQQQEGPSTVMPADLYSERMLVPVLHLQLPSVYETELNVPFLCEESENSRLAELIPTFRLLPYSDEIDTLPQQFVSVDGLDGSTLFANGELSLAAISVGFIKNGKPYAAAVMSLSSGYLYHVNISGTTGVFCEYSPIEVEREPWRELNKCLVGTDDSTSVSQEFREMVINKLMSTGQFSYRLNVPSVAGGLKVLLGNLAAYITDNARNWDIAGTAALCLGAGQVVRCLNGDEVPWNKVRMPPVVFARDEEAFQAVRSLADDYLAWLER